MNAAVLCLVTDRRRLATACGAPETDWRRLLVEQIEGAVRGGVDLVQVRERDLDDRVLIELIRDLVRLVGSRPTRILVNDRADLAIAAGAHGVHLREDSIPPAAARRLMGTGRTVSKAVHDAHTAAAADAVDFLVAGTVASTSSKPGGAVLGFDGLRTVVAATRYPVLAIGGIDASNAGEARRAGAWGVAAIGAFIPRLVHDIAPAVQNLTETLRFTFDTAGLRP